MARSKPLVGLAIGAFTLLSLAACQQLLGLDRLKNCDEDPCSDASALPDAADGSLPDGDADAGDAAVTPDTSIPFPDGSTPSDWVNFRMPATTGGLVDAASFPRDAAINKDDAAILVYSPGASTLQMFGTVATDAGPLPIDTVSARVWHYLDLDTSSFDSARAQCAAVGARVPSRIELVSLLEPSRPGDAGYVRREAFGGAPVTNLAFWSSTASREGDGGFSFWIVDFASGSTVRQPAAGGTKRGILCVR
jgi:hypothetical protein